ncbi:MAG: response regulator [Planctomycetes bacterium]|nr:response regulator [Planctomycetota bacterium]
MAKKILIIEDEPDIIKIAVFRIKQAGYEVFIAENGKQALESVYMHKPDLILLDLNLPVMSGSDVCRKIKATENFNSIPVILFTASNSSKLGEIASRLGVEDYISKPFDLETLLSKIKRLIEQTETVTTEEHA